MGTVDTSSMRQVCPDLDGVSQWYYDPATLKYMRVLPDNTVGVVGGGRMLARLAGSDVPNPDKLWDARCTMAGTNTTTIQGMKLKPSQTTYNLFHDWQVLNA